MCVAMVIIHTKTLEKKAVDDVTSKESLQPHEPVMSQALFSCGIMEAGRWPQGGGVCGPVGSSLESLWSGVRDPGGLSGLLGDLSLSEAPAPPSKRQCRSLSCSEPGRGPQCRSLSCSEPGRGPQCRSLSCSGPGRGPQWRPQGSRVWTAVEKRRCLSGGSLRAPERSLSRTGPGPQPQTLYLSQERIGPASPRSPDSPSLERRSRQGLARSRSQPCVHNDRKRRRPEDTHTHRPSLDLLKMTQELQDFHSLRCPGLPSDGSSDWPSEDASIHQSEGGWPGPKERECLWAGLCGRRGRDLQLGGELDIEQIERN